MRRCASRVISETWCGFEKLTPDIVISYEAAAVRMLFVLPLLEG